MTYAEVMQTVRAFILVAFVIYFVTLKWKKREPR